ncbi:MAG: zinc-dependent metalloprotease [Saprospiraceae bacterium]|nr:zinc-dependent metalloprotease [Saprospiraceae bacterium]
MTKSTLNFLFFLPLSIFTFFQKSQAQTQPQVCGLSAHDSRIIFDDMLELRERHPSVTSLRAVVYIPVWFHLVAKADGTGRVSMMKVLDMLCEWNRLYSVNGVEMQFYIKGVNNINNSTLYDAPRSYEGENLLKSQKKADGINVFMVNNANDSAVPDGTILGYYLNSVSGVPYDADWLVIINAQVSTAGAVTIAHEAGHYFGLPHTFQGWEACPFQPTSAKPCAPTTIDCFDGVVYNVENAARTGSSANCATAGDGFCDTPPDYNLGYGATSCTYIGLACDPKGIKIDPDEKNMMGYFTNCATTLSTMQKAAMTNNYLNHAKRAALRTGNVQPAATVFTLSTPTLLAPINGAKTQYFNNFTLTWQAVPNATAYVVEISKSTSFFDSRVFIANTNALNINKSMVANYFTAANTTYYWRVKPYNGYAACATPSVRQNFVTGLVSDVKELTEVSHFIIAPNPLSKTQNLQLAITTEKAFEAQIKLYNLTGQLVFSERRYFDEGDSVQTFSVLGLNDGFYTLYLESDKGVLTKKLVIKD